MRLYDISSINPVAKVQEKSKQAKSIILYSRVSSNKQRNDLDRQREFLKANLSDKYSGFKISEISDIGSGINFKRPGLLRVLGSIKEGNISTLVVASRDRLARFGFELIEWLCSEFGTEILVLDNTDSTPEEELGKDLMSIVQVYCCRWNGKRRYKASENSEQDIQIETQTNQEAERDLKPMVRLSKIHLQRDNSTTKQPTKQLQKQDQSSEQISSEKRQKKQKPKLIL
jgi:predicted site-specific integrase-resolvase